MHVICILYYRHAIQEPSALTGLIHACNDMHTIRVQCFIPKRVIAIGKCFGNVFFYSDSFVSISQLNGFANDVYTCMYVHVKCIRYYA